MRSNENHITAFKLNITLPQENYIIPVYFIREFETLRTEKDFITKNILITDGIKDVEFLNYGG
ncbi:hypothetical protein BMS3Abin03_00360 [bacterium BMS3Abin03]|nr:hypothetical protein BMS3Abin03_00360 [bacterium BMS3Abin03]